MEADKSLPRWKETNAQILDTRNNERKKPSSKLALFKVLFTTSNQGKLYGDNDKPYHKVYGMSSSHTKREEKYDFG